MEFIAYLFQLSPYIGLPILFGLSLVIMMLLVSLPFFIIYFFEKKSDMPVQTPINSSCGGAEACAVVCVAGI